MFTKPQYGWTNLQIGDFTERVSYLTDISNDCLDAFIYALHTGNPAVIFFDAEWWDFHLIASYYCSYVIVDKDKAEVYTIEKTIKELAKDLYDDINNNFDDWLNWDMDEDETDEERERNKRGLRKKLSDLELCLLT